jgi:hypothetical protein
VTVPAFPESVLWSRHPYATLPPYNDSWRRVLTVAPASLELAGVAERVASASKAATTITQPNPSSGGKLTPIDLGEFLGPSRAGPEHQALQSLIGSLAGTN